MLKSQSANTNQRHHGKLALALMAGGLMAGCGADEPDDLDPDDYDGIGEETFPLVLDPCTINVGTTTMTLTVRAGETLYLTLRAADNAVVAAAQTGTGGECAVPSTYKIAISESGPVGIEKVFLDYINGPFSIGTTVAAVVTPGITIVLGAGSSVTVRGSSSADKINLGSTYAGGGALAFNWININGDASPDVRMAGVTGVKVSTGVGADIISADGGAGTSGLALDATIAFSAFGGPDADTLTGGKGASTLDGGDGDDKFVQTATVGADNLVGGKGVDTVDYSIRVPAVNVTVCTFCAADPCACIASGTTCRGTADGLETTCNTAAATAQTTCNTNAGTAQTTCNTAAGTAQTTCNTNADGAQTTCNTAAGTAQTTCISGAGGCSEDRTACEALCGGNPTCEADCATDETACIGVCNTDHTDAVTACTDARTAAGILCTDAHTAAGIVCSDAFTAAGIVCTNLFTAAGTACTNTHTTSTNACNATQATCQAGCIVAACAICIGDDGIALEGDTVNDNVEIVLGGKNNDTLSASRAVCSDAAATPVVKCTLKGNEGDDTVTGSTHNDLIDGGVGNDTMMGGLGNDTFVGGAGFDTVSYADRSILVKVSLDSTKLWAVGQNGDTGENDVIPADVENLTGGGGNDLLRGNASANILHGGAGNDTLEGAAANDSLYGDAGIDLLYGGTGNDMLVGGVGLDTLVGGDGDDFIDSSDSPAAADTLIDCDGVNDAALTAGTSSGTADALVGDGSDTVSVNCELL